MYLKELIFFDNRTYTDEIRQYMPHDTNCPLSTVHKFITIDESKNKNGKYEFHFRIKFGPQFAYKLNEYFYGERVSILDFAGGTETYPDNYEDKAIDMFLYFMGKERMSCEGLLILQSLSHKIGEQMANFIKNVSKMKNFCDKNISVEDRTNIKIPIEELEKIEKKHYIEKIIPLKAFSGCESHFDRNVIDFQDYHDPTRKLINMYSNHFVYEGRKDDERETWNYLNWKLLEIINELFLVDSSNFYIKTICAPRLSSRTRIFI